MPKKPFFLASWDPSQLLSGFQRRLFLQGLARVGRDGAGLEEGNHKQFFQEAQSAGDKMISNLSKLRLGQKVCIDKKSSFR